MRTLQGNPYIPETQERARALLEAMNESYQKILSDPTNLLRPWGMDPIRGVKPPQTPTTVPSGAPAGPEPTGSG